MSGRLRNEFDVVRACGEIRELNGNALFAASDFIVAKQFTPYEVMPYGAAAGGIVIIDGLWATQLFRERGGPERMLRLYEENASLCREELGRLRKLRLTDQPDGVHQVAKGILGTLLDPEQPGRKHYSFATKLFHWHAPEHLPIVDARARKAINMLQKACGKRQGVVLADTAEMGGESYLDEYGRWVHFYSELLNELTPGDQEQLLAADRESLPRHFFVENPLLRVLDKVFYHRGG